MKKLINTIKNKANRAAIAIRNRRGDGYIDTGVKIIIGVVIGGVILAGLYALFSNTVIPTMQTKVGGFFNYTGA